MVPEYVSITTWCIWLQGIPLLQGTGCSWDRGQETEDWRPHPMAWHAAGANLKAYFQQSCKVWKVWMIGSRISIRSRAQSIFYSKYPKGSQVIAGDCRWLPVIAGDWLHHVASCIIMLHPCPWPPWPIMAHHGPSWLIGAGLQFHLLQRWQIQELHPGGWQRAAEVQLDILRVQWSHLAQEKFIWNRSFVHPISVIWRGLLVFFLQNQGHQYILEVDSNASSIWPIRLQKKCLNPKGYMTPHANRRWKG